MKTQLSIAQSLWQHYVNIKPYTPSLATLSVLTDYQKKKEQDLVKAKIEQHSQTCQAWLESIDGLDCCPKSKCQDCLGLLEKQVEDLSATLSFYKEKGVLT